MGRSIESNVKLSVVAAACTVAALGSHDQVSQADSLSQPPLPEVSTILGETSVKPTLTLLKNVEVVPIITQNESSSAQRESESETKLVQTVLRLVIKTTDEVKTESQTSHHHKKVTHTKLPTESELPIPLKRIGGCESAGSPTAPIDYRAVNPESPDHTGGFQFDPGTWAGRFGVKEALDATPDEQNAAAEQTYEQRGTEPWLASESCWG
jgi:hypothetical protein